MSQRLSIQHIKKFARSKGGICLARIYENAHQKLEWKCKEGHKWFASTTSVVNSRSWCPYCSGNRVNSDELNKIAKKKNGKCLSIKFLGSKHKYRWQCEMGHKFQMTHSDVKQGQWCPKCRKSQPVTLADLRKLARERGGRLVSAAINGNHSPLEWQCSQGHRWFARPSNIKTGTWCPTCSSGLGERICKAYFEQLFQMPFDKTRGLKWLISPTGQRLELDGYNARLKLAFEHQGGHHYAKARQHFYKKPKYDNLKEQLCQRHGVRLIKVPEINNRLKISELKNFIKSECKKMGIKVPSNFEEITVALREAYSPSRLGQLQQHAVSLGGRCLSSSYQGSHAPLNWICKDGHGWKASPRSILGNGSWCPVCAQEKKGSSQKLSIEIMQARAEEKGGRCLSSKYKSIHSPLKWECGKGHRWEARPSNIQQGKWCPYCAGRYKSK